MTTDNEEKKQQTVDLRAAVEKLRELPEAIRNRIRTERCASLLARHNGLPMVLNFMVQVLEQTFKAVQVLALERQHGELPPAALSVAIPPLARRFVDSIYTLVFVSDDLPKRLDGFVKSGWSSARQWQKRLDTRWGQDPKWQPWLADHRKWIDDHEKDLALTADEKTDPTKVSWWPNPGKMVKRTNDPTARAFLELLGDWHYGKLSQDAHLSYMGLARGAIVDDRHLGAGQHAYRQQVASAATVLYLAVLSEVAIVAQVPYERRRLREAWELVKPISDAGDLWEARYAALL